MRRGRERSRKLTGESDHSVAQAATELSVAHPSLHQLQPSLITPGSPTPPQSTTLTPLLLSASRSPRGRSGKILVPLSCKGNAKVAALTVLNGEASAALASVCSFALSSGPVHGLSETRAHTGKRGRVPFQQISGLKLYGPRRKCMPSAACIREDDWQADAQMAARHSALLHAWPRLALALEMHGVHLTVYVRPQATRLQILAHECECHDDGSGEHSSRRLRKENRSARL